MSSIRETNSKKRWHYYPENIINNKYPDLDKVLLYKRPHQNKLIYRVAGKAADN